MPEWPRPAVTTLPDDLLDQIVRSEAGPTGRIWRHDRQGRSRMNAVLDEADKIVGHPYVVYWMADGLPENFSRPDLNPAVIIFNSRYLELIGGLRGILTSGLMPDDLRTAAAEQVSLRVIAELTLRYGDPSLACHLLAASFVDQVAYYPPVSLATIELTPIGEMYMAVWFYALLHELGHVAAAHRQARPEPRPTSDSRGAQDRRPQDAARYLEDLVNRIATETFGDRPAGTQVRDQLDGSGSLNRLVLTAELDADLFAVQMLVHTTIQVMQASELLDEFDVTRLATEILLMFDLFHYLNNCGLAARRDINVTMRSDVWGNIANTVRLNIVIDWLALYLSTGGRPELGRGEGFDEVRARLIAAHGDSRNKRDGFAEGHDRAVRQCLFPDERRLDVLGSLAEQLEHNPDDPAVALEVRRFRELAASLEVSHPDIDLLTAITQQPTEATDILRASQKVYIVPWLSGPEIDQPLGLVAHDAYVVFVFARPDVADYFIEETRTMTRPEYQLGTTAVISPTEQNVRITLHRQLPDKRDRLQVVFEGTRSFDKRFEELNDGTFWATETS
jgi:hypothetical protein